MRGREGERDRVTERERGGGGREGETERQRREGETEKGERDGWRERESSM